MKISQNHSNRKNKEEQTKHKNFDQMTKIRINGKSNKMIKDLRIFFNLHFVCYYYTVDWKREIGRIVSNCSSIGIFSCSFIFFLCLYHVVYYYDKTEINQSPSALKQWNFPLYNDYSLTNERSLFIENLDNMMIQTRSIHIKEHLEMIKLQYRNLFSLITLHRCDHLYIDLGSSSGMQFRKLYQPNLYPQASVHGYFSALFGSDEKRNRVCSIGFEANPKHSSRLLKVQSFYQSRGFPMILFPGTIVSNTFSSNTTFYQDKGAPDSFHEWGSSTIPWDTKNHMKNQSISIPSIDIAVFLIEVFTLWHHYLSEGNTLYENFDQSSKETVDHASGKHRIVMKMDIEGSELTVLPNLLIHGLLCKIDLLFIEWHPHLKIIPETQLKAFQSFFVSLDKLHADYHCAFHMTEMDDETYFEGNDPFPL